MTLNIENFDRLYNYVDALPDDGEPRSWGITRCFGGIVAFEFGFQRKFGFQREGSIERALKNFLDIDDVQAGELFSMYSYDASNGDRLSRMADFENLSAAKQKVVMLDVLRTLRQEGRVAWDKAFTLVTDGAV